MDSGSPSSTPLDPDKMLSLELAERKLSCVQSRCEVQISAWMEQISWQLTEAGKELFSDLETNVKQLKSNVTSSVTENDVDINFVPRHLDKSDFGFLCHGNLLPTSFCLELLTRLLDIKVGARLEFEVKGQGPITTFMKKMFEIGVTCKSNDVPLSGTPVCVGERSIRFSFLVPKPENFTVNTLLYGQHVIGSPLVIPVSDSVEKSLARLGLLTISEDIDEYKSEDNFDDQCTDPIKSRLDLLVSESTMWAAEIDVYAGSKPGEVVNQLGCKVEEKEEVANGVEWKIGNDCIASSPEDGIWYNAIVDSVFGGTPVKYLVTFIDYGNSEVVYDSDLAVNADCLPVDQLEMLNDKVVRLRKFGREGKSSSQSLRKTIGTSNIDLHSSRLDDKETSGVVSTEVKDLRPNVATSKVDKLVKDTEIIAKREDDQTWYKAVIYEVAAPGRLYIVKFIDIGQFSGVSPEDIALRIEDIPEGSKLGSDMIGSVVKKKVFEKTDCTTKMWSVGEKCIARWSCNSVWYNAEVVNMGDASCVVKFVDYGNEEEVKKEDMARNSLEIPDCSSVDPNVDQYPDEINFDMSSVDVPQEYSNPIMNNMEQESKFSKSESVTQGKLFIDAIQANQDKLDTEKAKLHIDTEKATAGSSNPPEIIPSSVQCMLCKNVCRKAMRLVCNSSPVCWGCAVKEITRSHICWQCGAKNITSDTHLVKDQERRTFVEEFIKAEKIHTDLPSIHDGLQRTTSPLKNNNIRNGTILLPDESCLARLSDDGEWCKGLVTDVYGDGSAQVYFTDYGNSERVKKMNIVREVKDLPVGAKLDMNVDKVSKVDVATCKSLDFLSMASFDAKGKAILTARQTLLIKDLSGPIGVTVLSDGSLAVVCRSGNCVKRFDRNGVFLGKLKSRREFVMPTDILTLTSGEVAVRDEGGIQLFGRNLEFQKCLGEEAIDRCFGLEEDNLGRIITINWNGGSSKTKITNPGKTDLFVFDIDRNEVVKRVEMDDLIESAVAELHNLEADVSACRFLTYCDKNLYVIDMGLDCIFVLNEEGTESEMFGSRGNQGGQFRYPAGLVVDDVGNLMVVDSRNHRLQLIDKDLNFAGLVKVDAPLSRPSGIFLDRVSGDILVSNYLGKSVAIYKLDQQSTTAGEFDHSDGEMSDEKLKKEMARLLESDRKCNDQVIKWIDLHCTARLGTEPFIRVLTTAVVESVIDNIGINNNQWRLNEEELKLRNPVLKKYLGSGNSKLAVEAILALQYLMHRLNHPKLLLESIFEVLYDDDVLSEEAFKAWENNNDPADQESKERALKSCACFFTFLRLVW